MMFVFRLLKTLSKIWSLILGTRFTTPTDNYCPHARKLLRVNSRTLRILRIPDVGQFDEFHPKSKKALFARTLQDPPATDRLRRICFPPPTAKRTASWAWRELELLATCELQATQPASAEGRTGEFAGSNISKPSPFTPKTWIAPGPWPTCFRWKCNSTPVCKRIRLPSIVFEGVDEFVVLECLRRSSKGSCCILVL